MRGAAATLLVLVATLLTPLGVTAVWLSSTVDDTESYVDTVAPLADDPDLRRQLADTVTAAAVAALQQYSPVGLPDGLGELARTATMQVVESKEFPALWRAANADVHTEFLALMADDADPKTANGWVFVDMSPVLDVVLERLGERGVPVDMVPEVPLDVPVVQEEKLTEVRAEYRLVEGAAFWLPVVWVVLVGLAVAVSRGWRGRLRTGAFAGLGLCLGAALVWVGVDPARELAVDQVDGDNRDLVALVAEVVLDSLSSLALVVVVVAGLLGIFLLVSSMWPRRRGLVP